MRNVGGGNAEKVGGENMEKGGWMEDDEKILERRHDGVEDGGMDKVR